LLYSKVTHDAADLSISLSAKEGRQEAADHLNGYIIYIIAVKYIYIDVIIGQDKSNINGYKNHI